MISSFSFARVPRLIFGPGKIKGLPGIVSTYGNKALIVTGGSSLKSGIYWQELVSMFQKSAIQFDSYSIKGEPSPEEINECVCTYRNNLPDVVVAIGGGSVLDAGKAISAMLTIDNDVRDFLENVGTKTHPGTKLPFIAIPTTSGTGSEATKNAVLSEIGESGFKKSLRHDNFVPEIALLDPELTTSCPSLVTAYSGMDAFTQLLESYVSPAANIMTDSLATEALRFISKCLIPAWKNGSDIESRSGMSYAAYISGITLANAGLGTVHGFASSVGGYYNIPHGVICSRLMEPVNSITVSKLRKISNGGDALKKYVHVGKIFSDKTDKSDEFYVDFLLNLIGEWTDLFNIPRLSHFGIQKNDFSKIVAVTENKNNPVKLDEEDLFEVLNKSV